MGSCKQPLQVNEKWQQQIATASNLSFLYWITNGVTTSAASSTRHLVLFSSNFMCDPRPCVTVPISQQDERWLYSVSHCVIEHFLRSQRAIHCLCVSVVIWQARGRAFSIFSTYSFLFESKACGSPHCTNWTAWRLLWCASCLESDRRWC